MERHFFEGHFTQHFSELAVAVDAMRSDKDQEKHMRAVEFLDDSFPLDEGSHQDVTQYVMDYHHLLAYFSDGSHCGLRYPQQFTGIDGEAHAPGAILFSTEEGNHIEVELCSDCQLAGRVRITDIQVEVISRPFAEFTAQETDTFRCWISLLNKNSAGRAIMTLEDKEFIHKDGHEFTILVQD
ncbi:hypothetical protein OAP63_14640 [Vibrio sp.]|uniref:Malate synthase G alpha-beta insertion domain-containing protein n=1 Tax=Vibrio viridaestus TaxID=2487322 RepID=A0A3N9TKT8_9VIBR|nr:hypothetical protein [Vibrio viridaestus]MDC0611967.1 hypothetical protein [Vibrio sp.]RQW64890.1 hypothetical protein EES38_02305 [Vibrio viridaestus]